MSDSPEKEFMQTRKVSPPPSSKTVEIRIDSRVGYLLAAVVGIIVLFAGGLFVGRQLAGPAAAPAQQQAAVAQQQPGQQIQVQPADQAGSLPTPVPTYAPPAGKDVPIGDAPRLALPELEASNYVYDFGEIGPNDKAERTFVIKNTGTKELVITDAKSGWGCTASLVSDKNVPAGGETTIKVAYDPNVEKNRGAVKRRIAIFSNDPAAPVASFIIQVNVRDN